jgi:hypothetical protein
MAAGGLGGGISSKLAGGTFEDGFRNGLISAGLNHGLHALANGIHKYQEYALSKPKEAGEFQVIRIKLSSTDCCYTDYHENVTFDIPVVGDVDSKGKLYWRVYDQAKFVSDPNANGDFTGTMTQNANAFATDIDYSFDASYAYKSEMAFSVPVPYARGIAYEHIVSSKWGYWGHINISNSQGLIKMGYYKPVDNFWISNWSIKFHQPNTYKGQYGKF